MFGEEETLGIDGKSEYNQQFHGFMDGPNFKICEVKKLSNWLANPVLKFCAKISNSSTDRKMRLL